MQRDDERRIQKHAIELRVRGTFLLTTFSSSSVFRHFQSSSDQIQDSLLIFNFPTTICLPLPLSSSSFIVYYNSLLLLRSIFPCDFNKSLFCLLSIMLIVIAGFPLEFRLGNGRWLEPSIKHRSIDLRDISLFPMFEGGNCGRNCSMIEWLWICADMKSFVEPRKSCWEMKTFFEWYEIQA